MDELLEVAGTLETLGDLGLDGVFTWVLRIIGLILMLAGIGLWLFTNMGLLVIPAALIAVGLVLLIAPSILLLVAELAG